MRRLPPSPFGTTMIGANQLEWLFLITPASKNLSISLPTGSVSLHWGRVSVKLDPNLLCQLTSV